jgi:hypothetical protein
MKKTPATRVDISDDEIVQDEIKWKRGDFTPDTTFFHKSQIKVGTALEYRGRMRSGSIWVVESIRPHYGIHHRGPRKSSADIVTKLADIVILAHRYRDGSGSTKKITKEVKFSYLSYSAIWRIVDM